MKNKAIRVLKFLFPIVFWLGVWEVTSLIIDSSFLMPDVSETFSAMIDIITDENFLLTVLMTLSRVLLGLAIGIGAGIILAVLSHHVPIANTLISPILSVIKSTPVASFIIVLWALLSGYILPVFIAFLMVMPIVWQNMLDGYSYIDKDLSEVCDVFEFSYRKRAKYLIIPTLRRYLVPAVITSVGLAWKAEIAAEIIDFTDKSIGYYINYAKKDFDSARVFAWTVIIILFSFVLEKITKNLLARYKHEPQN